MATNKPNKARVGGVSSPEGYKTESRKFFRGTNPAKTGMRTAKSTVDPVNPNPLRRRPSFPDNAEKSKIKGRAVV